jgi:hypothetical protein
MFDENQHWVPKFLIKYFADRDGRVFCLDIHTDEVTKPPPKLATSEYGFNDFLIDGKAVSFEDKLEKIETPAAPVLKRMIEGRTLAGLTSVDRVVSRIFRTFD